MPGRRRDSITGRDAGTAALNHLLLIGVILPVGGLPINGQIDKSVFLFQCGWCIALSRLQRRGNVVQA